MTAPVRALIATFDVGGLDADALRRCARLVEGALGDVLRETGLATTWFLDADALSHAELVRAIVELPRVETGLSSSQPSDGGRRREDELDLLAALHRQARGVAAAVHRGPAGALDAELGPLLLERGIIVDLSAQPFTAAARGLPGRPWRSSEDGDLTRPGRGPLLEIPVSVRAPFRDARHGAVAPAVWDPTERAPLVGVCDLFHGLGWDDPFPTPLVCRSALGAMLDDETFARTARQLRRIAATLSDDALVAVTATAFLAHVDVDPPDVPRGPVRAHEAERLGLVLIEPDAADLVAARRTLAGGGRVEVVAADATRARRLAEDLGPGALWVGGKLEDAAVRGDRRHHGARIGATGELARFEDHLTALRRTLLPGASLRWTLPAGWRAEGAARCARVLRAVAAAAGFTVLACDGETARLAARAPAPIAARADRDPDEGISFCIISGGARPEVLARAIGAIAGQDLPAFEVIVAGVHAGTPGVRTLAMPEEAASGRLGALRNAAVAAARFDRVCLLDDDILLAPGWARALRRRTRDFDLLTSQLRVPDGGRYWDHATVGGPRGHVLLEDGEDDAFLYATGGGAWLMSRRVFEAVSWNDRLGFYEGEDVDLSRRIVAAGFTIEHDHALIALHADDRYTSIGRRCLARERGVSAAWVLSALKDEKPGAIVDRARRLRDDGRRAESGDALRHGLRLHPGHRGLLAEWGRTLQEGGGALADCAFRPLGSRLAREILTFADAHRARPVGAIR